jgi:hypothetical protein
MLSYQLFHARKEMTIRGNCPGSMMSIQTLSIENTPKGSLLQLQCAPEHCHEEEQCLITLIFACSVLP